jgi:hypothetical protein
MDRAAFRVDNVFWAGLVLMASAVAFARQFSKPVSVWSPACFYCVHGKQHPPKRIYFLDEWKIARTRFD